MAKSKLTKFWKELKRRKVVKVTIIYASTAFILLQLINILIEPLHLPEWVMTFFVVFLLVGFPIVVILSWIFDITPQGIEVTQPVSDIENKGQIATVSKKKTYLTNGFIGVLLIVVTILAYPKIFNSGNQSNINSNLEKSIAVLPFKNDSNDSTNVYIINGLMESILNNLAKVKDLRVISRTSVEKYRNNPKLITEMAKDLNVSYIVEGSGQKIGDQILLTVQLLDASNDKHLWSEQYNKEAKDIFNLQIEVSKTIADKIQAIITPEEEERIKKVPTDNLTAYDYYLKGSELLNKGGAENLYNAIPYFEKALEHDNEFALAYAELAITYFWLDNNRTEKRYSIQTNNNADKALLYDPHLDMSLIAKGGFYINQKEYELAIPYFEKALQYNPNSYLAIMGLADIYSWGSLDAEKSLEYFLKAISLDIPANDSIDKSNDYCFLSDAFREAGFFKEAEMYINKSLEISPDNLQAVIEKGTLLIQMSGDYQQAIKLYTEAYSRDSTNYTIIRTLFNTYYQKRDFASAYKYGNKIIKMWEAYNREMLGGLDDGRFGCILSKIGKDKESEEYFRKYKDFAETNKSVSKYRDLVAVYALGGDPENAIEQMRIYSEQNNYPYYMIRLFKEDPFYDNIRNLPEFKEILSEMETKFWKNHDRIKASLEEKGLL